MCPCPSLPPPPPSPLSAAPVQLPRGTVQAHAVQQAPVAQLLRTLLQARDLAAAARENAGSLNEEFFMVTNTYIAMAQKEGNVEVASQLESVLKAAWAEKQKTLRPEIRLLNRLLELPTAEERIKVCLCFLCVLLGVRAHVRALICFAHSALTGRGVQARGAVNRLSCGAAPPFTPKQRQTNTAAAADTRVPAPHHSIHLIQPTPLVPPWFANYYCDTRRPLLLLLLRSLPLSLRTRPAPPAAVRSRQRRRADHEQRLLLEARHANDGR